MTKVIAPFSEEQVVNINAYQHAGIMHPFTCGYAGDQHRVLEADTDGIHCVDCIYTQNWVHDFMANWTLQELKSYMEFEKVYGNND